MSRSLVDAIKGVCTSALRALTLKCSRKKKVESGEAPLRCSQDPFKSKPIKKKTFRPDNLKRYALHQGKTRAMKLAKEFQSKIDSIDNRICDEQFKGMPQKNSYSVDEKITKYKAYLFAEKPEDIKAEQFNCPICLQIVVDPSSTPCGHTFCYKCLDESQIICGACPICRENIKGLELSRCGLLQRIIEMYKQIYFRKKAAIVKTKQNRQNYEERLKVLREWRQRRNVNLKIIAVGDRIDARDPEMVWCKAIIKQIFYVRGKAESILIHYEKWNKIYDQVIDLPTHRIANQNFYSSRTDISRYNPRQAVINPRRRRNQIDSQSRGQGSDSPDQMEPTFHLLNYEGNRSVPFIDLRNDIPFLSSQPPSGILITSDSNQINWQQLENMRIIERIQSRENSSQLSQSDSNNRRAESQPQPINQMASSSQSSSPSLSRPSIRSAFGINFYNSEISEMEQQSNQIVGQIDSNDFIVGEPGFKRRELSKQQNLISLQNVRNSKKQQKQKQQQKHISEKKDVTPVQSQNRGRVRCYPQDQDSVVESIQMKQQNIPAVADQQNLITQQQQIQSFQILNKQPFNHAIHPINQTDESNWSIHQRQRQNNRQDNNSQSFILHNFVSHEKLQPQPEKPQIQQDDQQQSQRLETLTTKKYFISQENQKINSNNNGINGFSFHHERKSHAHAHAHAPLNYSRIHQNLSNLHKRQGNFIEQEAYKDDHSRNYVLTNNHSMNNQKKSQSGSRSTATNYNSLSGGVGYGYANNNSSCSLSGNFIQRQGCTQRDNSLSKCQDKKNMLRSTGSSSSRNITGSSASGCSSSRNPSSNISPQSQNGSCSSGNSSESKEKQCKQQMFD